MEVCQALHSMPQAMDYVMQKLPPERRDAFLDEVQEAEMLCMEANRLTDWRCGVSGCSNPRFQAVLVDSSLPDAVAEPSVVIRVSAVLPMAPEDGHPAGATG